MTTANFLDVWPGVVRAARAFTRRTTPGFDGDDVAQLVALKELRHPRPGGYAPGPWVRVAVRSAFIDLYRRARFNRRAAGPGLLAVATSRESDPAARVATADLVDRVRREVEQLSPVRRGVIDRRYWLDGGLSRALSGPDVCRHWEAVTDLRVRLRHLMPDGADAVPASRRRRYCEKGVSA